MESNNHSSNYYKLRLINTKLPLYFEFPTNPNRISFDYRKIFQETRTIGGFIFEHWGKRPTLMHVEGRMLKIPGTDALGGIDSEATSTYLDTNGWQDTMLSADLFKLRQLYEIDKRKMTSLWTSVKDWANLGSDKSEALLNSMSDTLIQYKHNIYTGFFSALRYDERGETPFHNEYSFDFVVTNSLEDVLRNVALQSGLGTTIYTVGTTTIGKTSSLLP